MTSIRKFFWLVAVVFTLLPAFSYAQDETNSLADIATSALDGLTTTDTQSTEGDGSAESSDSASDGGEDAAAEDEPAPVDTSAQPAIEQLSAETGPDYEAWERVAVRAEQGLANETVSSFALDRLRSEIVNWRDELLAAESINSTRIDTVKAQIAALGEKPADGESEPQAIADRRETLNTQLETLMAPAVLAQEAYVRANGLVAEIDAVIRERQTQHLIERGPLPLNPVHWVDGATAMWNAVTSIANETNARIVSRFSSGRIWESFIQAALMFVVGTVLIARGRSWIIGMQDKVIQGAGTWADALQFIISLGQILLPLLGVWIITTAANVSGLLGFRGQLLVEALPYASLHVIIAKWISFQFFPEDPEKDSLLGTPGDEHKRARRIVWSLGWLLTIGYLLTRLVTVTDEPDTIAGVVLLPIELLLAFFLYQFGRLLFRTSKKEENKEVYRYRFFAVAGRIAMVIAVVGALLALAGYDVGARALLYPAVRTLSVLAVIMLIQRLIIDLYIVWTGSPDSAADALMPVISAFLLIVISLPILALMWGVREADLLELWSRFREGFIIGETRISPGDFVTFAAVFAIGYSITRFIQSTLRSTVLPKTRLDIGGQNAAVSGIGYLGIFLAAVIAITTAGIDLSSLAIVAGALSVGVGFGLQTIVSNFVSGIILLIERPISEGDWIQVGDQMGHVRSISVRSTRIETFDRKDVIIPNADLVSGQVTNWTRGNSVGRVIVPVGVAYGTDSHRVEEILREVAEAHPMVLLNPPPNVYFRGFGADSLDFDIRAIIRDIHFIFQVQSEMNHEINRRFSEEGIEIPFAQRDLWLRNPEALREMARSQPGEAEQAEIKSQSAEQKAVTSEPPQEPIAPDVPEKKDDDNDNDGDEIS